MHKTGFLLARQTRLDNTISTYTKNKKYSVK